MFVNIWLNAEANLRDQERHQSNTDRKVILQRLYDRGGHIQTSFGDRTVTLCVRQTKLCEY